MTWRIYLVVFFAAVVWLAAIAVARAQDCNDNGVPDDIDLAGRMYWTDEGTFKIQRADPDGTNVEDLVTGLNQPIGIALDPAAGKMYWTDVGTMKIQRADLDGTGVENLVATGLVSPFGLALDPAAGKMYWTDSDAFTANVRRADLDGTNVEDLVTTGLVALRFIALAVPSPDTDADGVMDECDGCPTDPTKTVPGICGCGVSDADTDGDGVPDCFDPCPNDPNKLDPGICGCGTPDSLVDGDGDGVIDCLDNCPTTANADQTDSNGNGVGDVCEPGLPAGCGCGNGLDGIMVMPITLLGIGWMRRRQRMQR